jgi:hypothetical protein
MYCKMNGVSGLRRYSVLELKLRKVLNLIDDIFVIRALVLDPSFNFLSFYGRTIRVYV